MNNDTAYRQLIRLWPVYRCIIILILPFLASGLLIKIFKRYKVNYLWGFSLRRPDQVSPNKLIRIYLGLMAII